MGVADIFISYARAKEATAGRIAETFRGLGYTVWRDDELPPHRSFAQVIEEAIDQARAVVVLWSAEAARSEWVQSEADRGRAARKLVQLTLDGSPLPMPFDRIQCADLTGWNGDMAHPGWGRVMASLGALMGAPAAEGRPHGAQRPAAARPILAVLPFDNLSGDAGLDYFSDGVSEEIQLTVARGADLSVVGRGSSFQFRGRDKAARTVGEALGVTHILDGSVRRSGERVRISAQLVECTTSTLLWTERYDRELSDIFALQDDIAEAVAAALKLAFKASPQPQTIDPAAYDRYLKARAIAREDNTPKAQAVRLDLLKQVVELAPDFALAWGSLATVTAYAMPRDRDAPEDPLYARAKEAAERAIALDPDCGVAYTALAYLKPAFGDYAEKLKLFEEGVACTPNDTWTLAGLACAYLMVGRTRESLDYWNRVVAHEPLSPRYGAIRAFHVAGAGEVERALKLTAELGTRFPAWRGGDGGRLLVAIYSGRLDLAEAVLAQQPERFAHERSVVRRLRELEGMAALDKAQALEARFAETDTLYLADLGLAADMGFSDLAFETFDEAMAAGRPIGGWKGADTVGRAVAACALFTVLCRALRPDRRFVRMCVRLGLYDYWRQSGLWPDCMDDLPYDLKAECEAAAKVATPVS